MSIEKLLPGVQKNISLAEHTSFKIGGPADYFFQAKTKQDLIKAVEAAVFLDSPFFILGGGSNILVGDKGYRGLAIKVQSSKFKVQNNNSKFKIICDAGVALKDLVAKTAELGLIGLEWAAGIPGTIGGAVRGNAGAFGKSMGDSVKEVEALEVLENKTEIKKYSKNECSFSYRNSIFKKKRNFTPLNNFATRFASAKTRREGEIAAKRHLIGLIILSAVFQFKKGDKEKIKKQIQENINYRKRNHPLSFPSAGSIFKNLPEKPAAQLIEKCGLKGKKIGQAQISEKHSNFIINLGGAKAKDVKALINLAKLEIKKKFGIELEEEVTILSDSERL